MKRLFPLPILFAILVLAGNCQKSELSFENPGGNNNNTVGFSISGIVLDKDNAPVGQAEVKAGNVTGRTDADGFFMLNNVKLPAKNAFVKVEKSGYFQGSRTFIAHEGAVNYVNIRLIPKDNSGSFSGAGGGAVTLPSGCSINFQPNSIVDAQSNSAYTGTVSVSAFFIDPSDAGFLSIMPGDLRGVTTAGEPRGLRSFGMMAVELTGAGGQKLQLATGKPATLNFAIPATLVAKAPATIPLWFFDETTGLWKEEGSATKQGSKYVGNVNHFSFWNCDDPFAIIEFQALVRDQNGHAVVDALVTITKLDDGSIGTGKTDDAGRVSGMIPANASLQLKISDRCGNQLHTQNIGPFAGSTNLGTIAVNVPPQAALTITGTVVNCSNAPVTNGFVSIKLDGLGYRTNINNGNFNITITRCNANAAQAELFAEDVGNTQQSSTQTINVTSGNVNAGQLSACAVSTNTFVNYTVDGTNYSLASPGDLLDFYFIDSLGLQLNELVAYNTSQSRSLTLDYKAAAVTGTFGANITVIENSTKYEGSGISTTITQYGNPGQFVTGNFSGTVLLGGVTPKNITGTFKVRRRQ